MTHHSLGFKLLLLSAMASTLPALVITGIHRSISSRALLASIQRHQTELARRVAEEVNGEIRTAQGLVAFVTQTLSSHMQSSMDQQATLENLLHTMPAFQEAMIVTDAGQERIKVNRRGPETRLSRRLENFHAPFISAPFFSGNRLPTIFIAEPIRATASHPASEILLVKMSFASLGTLMQQTQIGPRGIAYIVDERGALLAHPDQARVRAHANFALLPVVQDWIHQPLQPTGLRDYRDPKNIPVIALAYPIPLLKSAVVVQQPQSDVYAPLVRMRNQFIVWTLCWVCVFMGVTIAVAWHILQPLRQLQAAAEQIGQGKMDVHLKIHTHDELEDLAATFTRMAGSLQKLETLRRDLISMIIHDLKIPLSSILASLDYLLAGELGKLNSDQYKFLHLARRSGQDLLLLIQNLLDVAKLEEGQLSLRKEAIDPVEWADRVVASFRPLAESGKKQLQLTRPQERLPLVEGDLALLNRVLANLLSNALYHTPFGLGEVVVSLYPDGNQLAVQVRDNGEGIPTEDQERIFEKFAQADRKRGHLRSGVGLGLTFCKMVVEAHSGRIVVYSIPGQGSIFTFYLPLKSSAPPLSVQDKASTTVLRTPVAS